VPADRGLDDEPASAEQVQRGELVSEDDRVAQGRDYGAGQRAGGLAATFVLFVFAINLLFDGRRAVRPLLRAVFGLHGRSP
jgi:hypothetical protein